MIRLHHADHLETLLDDLADVYRGPVADPFAPELVVVPSAGIADAVMAGLGQRLGETAWGAGDGIFANIDFVYPGRFVSRALGDHSTGEVVGDPWDLDRSTWAVLEVLDAERRSDERRLGIPADLDAGPLWVLARHIADLFDRYATQRPQMIEQWAKGVDTDAIPSEHGGISPLPSAHRWQADVWRAVRARIAVTSPAELMPHLLRAVRSGDLTPALPSRVAVFGFGALSPGLLAVLRAVSERHEVHAYLQHPSTVAWTGLDSSLGGALQVRGPRDLTTHLQHPLLASWGRPSLEARALLNGVPEVEFVEASRPWRIPPDVIRLPIMLLDLQEQIRRDDEPWSIPSLRGDDGTLQVHACHGEVRQLEVLRDALGHLFTQDESLEPHHVHVLCPDLERFAPLIRAVFDRGELPIPVRVGDRSLTVDDPFAGALHTLLSIVDGRASLSDVLALVQYEPVRRRFGWSLEHVEQLTSWAVDTGARWGLEAHHRTEWGLPGDIATGTWRATVDRLLMGIALSAPSPRQALGDVAPFDDIGGDDIWLVGTLADLLERLLLLHERVDTVRPIAEWAELLHATIDDFLAVDRREPWGLSRLHGAVHALVESATSSASASVCAVDLSFADLRMIVDRTIGDRPGRLSMRSGAVTVTSMVPLHGVPARVVCILGLDDGSLSTGSFDGDDVLGSRPCIGERHPRHEGRQALLDAVLSASENLIITCNGADLTTNKPIPFVVPLVELLDVAAQLLGHPAGTDPNTLPFVVRHPRHGFDERALQAGALSPMVDGPFTFDRTMLDGALARRSAAAPGLRVPVTSGSRWALPPIAADVVSLVDVLDAVSNPSRTYLRDRLDVRLPSESGTLSDDLDLGVDRRIESSLGRQLLETWRSTATGATGGPAQLAPERVESWRRAVAVGGNLPPGEIATPTLDAVVSGVERVVRMTEACGVPMWGAETVDIDVVVGGVTVKGTVGGIVRSGAAGVLVDAGFRRPKASTTLQTALRLAALQLAEPETEWSAVVVRRPNGKAINPKAFRMRLDELDGDRTVTAERVLHMGVEVLRWALRDAVPLLEQTSAALADGDAVIDDSLASDCKDEHVSRLWADVGAGGFLAAPVLALDPESMVEFARANQITGRARACAHWVWSTVTTSSTVLHSNRSTPPARFDAPATTSSAKKSAARKSSTRTVDVEVQHVESNDEDA